MTTKGLGAPEGALGGELAGLLVGIQRLVRRRLRERLTEPRLRGAQVELLRLVIDTPGLRVSEAARELCLAGNSVSTLVNQLIGLGLLRRETDPADRRAALLHATPEAVARLSAWQARRTALVNEVVAGLPAEQRATLTAALPALRAVAEGLREAGDSGSDGLLPGGASVGGSAPGDSFQGNGRAG
ncbi:MarR family transcriptional regulator [Kitasatospora sp. MMS16-BH015]|uniref:MarR family winged helix-turn-helix transcriptional regulator n=1 Tax=Kitasatospora sp. MMS16-BH015 TaxID=2018025 RepID=UPI000CA0C10D|nr:MarR family transcriptional regulator [Kitasatospora sp. MMS16-BH015]AUG75487.1 MarR family transcriptional regulator [Kitasatospora sp. MMS16-BH015]